MQRALAPRAPVAAAARPASRRVAPSARPAVRAQAVKTSEAKVYKAELVPGAIGEAINAVRFLAIDGVNAANSGHPGLPMGCAPMSTVLFSKVFNADPADPKWADRDRFVLSAGHGSMLQYALLHLLGYKNMTVSLKGVCGRWGRRRVCAPRAGQIARERERLRARRRR
jgi:hypothetical protein